MFNSLLLMHKLVFISIIAFFIFFIFRHLFIKRKLSIFVYHVILSFILFVSAVTGGSVQNDGYERLEKFIELEKNHKLSDAKQNPQNYHFMFAIDLQEFENSDEFKAYLKKYDIVTDKSEAIFIGWLLVLISEIAMMCVYILRCLASNTIFIK